MTGDIDYRAVDIPEDTTPENYTYAERRAEILQRIEDAGSPRLLNGADLADRYGCTRQNIANDFDRLAEWMDDASGDRLATVVNQIGAVSGATALPSQQLDVFLDIDANGPWEIVVAQPFAPEAEVRVPPARTDGAGNAVVGPIELAAGTTASGTHSGDGNFIVEFLPETAMFPTDGELVFNELDDFDGETVVSTDGVGWFDVEADGRWSLEIE